MNSLTTDLWEVSAELYAVAVALVTTTTPCCVERVGLGRHRQWVDVAPRVAYVGHTAGLSRITSSSSVQRIETQCLTYEQSPTLSSINLTFRVLHGSASPYLGPLVPVRSLPGRRSLRSTGTNRLLVPSVKRSTVGSRAFPVAGPKTWNALPEDVTSSQSEYTFCRQLKTCLFKKSFPDIII